MNTSPYEENYASLNLLQLLKKWRKQLGIIALVSIVLSAIFTMPFFIHPMYKSVGIIYPVNLSSYSTESPTEQLLQLYESDEIKRQLIQDFKLYEHYEIDSTQKTARTQVYKQLTSNLTVNKTDYESVKLELLDTDPVTAKQMADSVIEKGNRIARSLYREKTNEVLVIVQKQFDSKKKELDSLDNALRDLRIKSGIIEFSQQTRELTRAYYSAVLSKSNNPKLDTAFKNFQEYGGEYVTLNENINRTRSVYNDYKQYVENATKDIKKEITYSNVVTVPEIPDKKSYPIRSLIVLMFTASVVFLSFIGIVVYENSQEKNTVK